MHLVHEMLVPVLPAWVQGLVLFAVYALAVMVLGAALHYSVERPFLRWRDHRAQSRSTVAPLPAGDVAA
ncbi:hypothetical protein G8A07_05030 [Roseateles sp. DAIF2]|uniref:hypothetical protein n=1 Tax=Roseateles sp. DAIF2 TaxID=2714952 RepID=UPI0018A2C1D7|nr:hypothetical protein [Roseateles sp. DAIF2]QPF72359.1 hypothetical protein G8A07_05030 [Roseateles sp. DAIF2]